MDKLKGKNIWRLPIVCLGVCSLKNVGMLAVCWLFCSSSCARWSTSVWIMSIQWQTGLMLAEHTVDNIYWWEFSLRNALCRLRFTVHCYGCMSQCIASHVKLATSYWFYRISLVLNKSCIMQRHQIPGCSIIQRLLCCFSPESLWSAKWFLSVKTGNMSLCLWTNVFVMVDKVKCLNITVTCPVLRVCSFLCCDNFQSLTSVQ